MAFDLLSNFVGLLLKDRFEEIEDFRLHASDIQSEQLFNLLREAEDTEWGKKFDFKNIFSYQDFRERLPIQKASDIRPFIERMEAGEINLLWPSAPKGLLPSLGNINLPVSVQAIEETFFQGINDSYAIHLHQNPFSKLFEGYSVTVGYSEEDSCMNGLSSLLQDNEPFISSLLNMPKRLAKDKNRKFSTIQLLKEIKDEKVSSFKGSPDCLISLLEKAGLNAEKSNLKEIWPDSEIYFHKGTESTKKRIEAKSLIPKDLSYQATYCSPEGLFGIQDDPNDSAFLLMLDLSIFYEFLPVNSAFNKAIPLEGIELNTEYQMVITNCSGLWRFCSEGPTLQFVSKNPYRFILI